MRPRSFTLNTLEIILPVALAAALAVGAFLFLNPVFGQERSGNPGIIRIYASVPSPDFDSIVHGTQMAIDEVNAKAGDFRIEFVPLSDAKKQDNGSYKWDPDVELANARRAVDDPDAMVYIGTYNSGAAKISITVLNRVSMAMISPGNTYPGLTKPGTGTAGEPYVYYPLGVRNYFRVVPAAQLTGDGATWYAKYKSEYPNDKNEDFASFGYEAGKVAISAIQRTNKKDREAIRQAVAATGTDVIQGDHILGDWKFDANGDTSLVTISVQNLGQNPQTGQYAWLYKGIMKYAPDTKQWTFVPQVVKP
jgi:ABC-type branched-subunit amino acid transport system substrate-binding protein